MVMILTYALWILKRHLIGKLDQNDGGVEAVAGGLEGSKIDK